MGYRSDVAIRCGSRAYEMFREVFVKEELCIAPDKIYKDGNEYILSWEWVKWYSDYDGVSAITEVMDRLDCLDEWCDKADWSAFGYKFIRIGEDNDDIEVNGNDLDIELWITRKIEMPDGLEEIREECI